MRGRALNAKYSVSLCLPFLSSTFPPPELFTADKLKQLEQLLLILQRGVRVIVPSHDPNTMYSAS